MIIMLILLVIGISVIVVAVNHSIKNKRNADYAREILKNDPSRLILVGSANDVLEADRDFLIYFSGNEKKTIPINILPYVTLTPPGSLSAGSLTLPAVTAPSGYISWGAGVTTSLSNDIKIVYPFEWFEMAQRIEQHILNVISGPQQSSNPSYSENTDELRKLKSLFDDGIITQEEFETKKKQLLGI